MQVQQLKNVTQEIIRQRKPLPGDKKDEKKLSSCSKALTGQEPTSKICRKKIRKTIPKRIINTI